MRADRIPPAEALFLGEALAPLLGDIKQALSDSHPRLCARIRDALNEVSEGGAVVNRGEVADAR